jgi:hypothetical protein
VLLARRPPFNGATDDDTLRAIEQGALTFRGPYKWDSISEECQDIIQQFLKSTPKGTPIQALTHPIEKTSTPRA